MVVELIFAGYLNRGLQRTGGVAVVILGFRTCPHTTSRYIECFDIRHRLLWWNRGGWWGPCWLIFCVPIVWSSRTCPHGHGVSGYLPPQVINHNTYVSGYTSLFVCFDVRQGHSWTIFFAEFRWAVPKHNKLTGITTHGFMSQRGELCMIIFLSPLRSYSTFFLYSPTILLEKNCQFINYCCYQVDQKWTKIRQDTRYQIQLHQEILILVRF